MELNNSVLEKAIKSLRKTELMPFIALNTETREVVDLAENTSFPDLTTQWMYNRVYGFNKCAERDVGLMCINGCFHFWDTVPNGKWAFCYPNIFTGKNGCQVRKTKYSQ